MAAAAIGSATVGDAQGKRGELDPAIQRLSGAGGPVAGRAVTARCAEGSVGALLRALDEVEPGDVVVVQGSGSYAYLGDLVAAEAGRRRVGALVIDGLVRDRERLGELEFPVFARGLTPRGARLREDGEVGVRLTLGRTEVAPGDWIVADVDGVVAVPAASREEVLARAAEIDAREAEAWERVRAGQPLREQLGDYAGGAS